MNKKLIAVIFAILLLLAAIPLPFTAGSQIYLFGWLPLSLAYWWVLMIVNLIFVLWVCRSFVRHSAKENKKEAEKEEKSHG